MKSHNKRLGITGLLLGLALAGSSLLAAEGKDFYEWELIGVLGVTTCGAPCTGQSCGSVYIWQAVCVDGSSNCTPVVTQTTASGSCAANCSCTYDQ